MGSTTGRVDLQFGCLRWAQEKRAAVRGGNLLDGCSDECAHKSYHQDNILTVRFMGSSPIYRILIPRKDFVDAEPHYRVRVNPYVQEIYTFLTLSLTVFRNLLLRQHTRPPSHYFLAPTPKELLSYK